MIPITVLRLISRRYLGQADDIDVTLCYGFHKDVGWKQRIMKSVLVCTRRPCSFKDLSARWLAKFVNMSLKCCYRNGWSAQYMRNRRD
jgi:hypothetical protein